MSKAWKGSTKAWRILRLTVLNRDDFKCKVKLQGCLGIADTADHIVPKSQGGQDHLSNLRAACTPCNSRRGDRPDDPRPSDRW